MIRGVSLQTVLDELLRRTGASRATLRQAAPDEIFPLTHEALAPDVASLRGVTAPNMARQPVVLEVAQGRQVVQEDCRSLYADDRAFHEMLELYGGMRAQIVTPVVRAGEIAAVISLHQLGRTRAWSEEEAALCRAAAAEVAALLELADG